MPIPCPSCSVENPEDSHSCGSCGSDLSHVAHTRVELERDEIHRAETRLDDASPPETAGPSLQPGRILGRRYRIERLLGQGGMGAVYKARDLELDRDVALKVIRPELSNQAGTLSRFKREIALSSRVTHRNVLRVFDLGEADGVRFLTMQFVEGRDLDDMLRRSAPLDRDEALGFFLQVVRGVAAAHAEGILHRDLKPQNVMVDARNQVYVTDFGLAKSQDLSALTHTGATMGTPHYMSPEQVQGKAVDARSDVYALGVMLYQLLSGQLPFSGDSVFSVMMARVRKPPRPLEKIRPDTPLYLRRIVSRCLEIDPALRYPSAAELLADLESGQASTSMMIELRRRRWLRPAAAVAAVVAGLAVAWLAWQAWPGGAAGEPGSDSTGAAAGAETLPEVPAVAVLPLANRTGQDALDWYGAGLARYVMDDLARSRHVRVVSARRAQDLAGDPRAARDAGIAYTVSGEILPGSDGDLSVAIRIVDTESGETAAARRVGGLGAGEIMTAADALSAEARKGIGLSPVEGVDVWTADVLAGDPRAYRHYVDGLGLLADYRYGEAEAAFRAALDVDPGFTMARFRLGMLLGISGKTAEATTALEQAVSEAADLPDREARYIRAFQVYLSRDLEAAAAAYTDLIAAYPHEIEARQLLAEVLVALGRSEEALQPLRTIARLEPGNATNVSMLGETLNRLGRYGEAVVTLQDYLAKEPGTANSHHVLGDAYFFQDELELAAAEYEKALQVEPDFHHATVSLARTEWLQGRQAEAEARYRSLVTADMAAPRLRIDAALELASLLRSLGRFEEAAGTLAGVEDLLAAEQVREAMALSVRARCRIARGELGEAAALAARAVERSPGVPTRYLFARGLVELAGGDPEAARATAGEIRTHALPPENPDRTEDKAAAYLEGEAALMSGDASAARAAFSRALGQSGYEYALYRLGLAEAARAEGQLAEALAAANEAARAGERSDPRLDLEVERLQARLLAAEIRAEMGQTEQASRQAAELADLWAGADEGWPPAAAAGSLAGR